MSSKPLFINIAIKGLMDSEPFKPGAKVTIKNYNVHDVPLIWTVVSTSAVCVGGGCTAWICELIKENTGQKISALSGILKLARPQKFEIDTHVRISACETNRTKIMAFNSYITPNSDERHEGDVAWLDVNYDGIVLSCEHKFGEAWYHVKLNMGMQGTRFVLVCERDLVLIEGSK